MGQRQRLTYPILGCSLDQAFYRVLAATYFAIARLNLPVHNAARDWLRETEQSLADRGDLVPIRLMSIRSVLEDDAV